MADLASAAAGHHPRPVGRRDDRYPSARRTKPLETELVDGLKVPTLPEMARVKGWLLATRHTVRDYLDTVVLLERLGEAAATDAFATFDELYAQESGASPLVEVV